MIYLIPIVFIFILYIVIRNNYKKDTIEGVCAICDEVFPDENLDPIEDLFLCKEHFKVYQENKWIQVKTVESSARDPEQSLYIQDLKDELKMKGIPSYIQTHYRHNGSEIVSIFKMFVKEKDRF